MFFVVQESAPQRTREPRHRTGAKALPRGDGAREEDPGDRPQAAGRATPRHGLPWVAGLP